MMKFHKIDHFEILMVMSHKSFIIFELGPKVTPQEHIEDIKKIQRVRRVDTMKHQNDTKRTLR